MAADNGVRDHLGVEELVIHVALPAHLGCCVGAWRLTDGGNGDGGVQEQGRSLEKRTQSCFLHATSMHKDHGRLRIFSSKSSDPRPQQLQPEPTDGKWPECVGKRHNVALKPAQKMKSGNAVDISATGSGGTKACRLANSDE